jgi:hypothetical protein
MSTDEQRNGPGLWILFPEIVGVSVIALLLPLPLVHLLLVGHVFLGAGGAIGLVGCGAFLRSVHTAAAVWLCVLAHGRDCRVVSRHLQAVPVIRLPLTLSPSLSKNGPNAKLTQIR